MPSNTRMPWCTLPYILIKLLYSIDEQIFATISHAVYRACLFFSFLLNKSTKPMNRICIDSMAHRFKQIACCFNYQLNSLFNQCSALNACMNSIKKHLMLFICIKCFLQSGCYKRSICEQDAKCYAYAENMSRTRTKHSTQSLFVSVIPQLVCLLNRPV